MRPSSLQLLRAAIHPEIGEWPAELFADHGPGKKVRLSPRTCIEYRRSNLPNDNPQELQSDLLRVELEFLLEKLRDLDRPKDACKRKHNRMADGRYENVAVARKEQWLVEISQRQRGGIDSSELKVFRLEGADTRRALWNVSGFRTEE